MPAFHTAVSRRAVLVSGVAVSLAAVSAPVSARNLLQPSDLSGRLTDEQGRPLRNARIGVAGVSAKTDGDGRFFVQALTPASGHITLQIALPGNAQPIDVSILPDRTRSEDQHNTSIAWALPA